MFKLDKALQHWNTPGFIQVFKQQVTELEHKELPLQQGLSLSSYVSDEKVSVVIHRTEETGTSIKLYCGVFYQGIIAGCSCSDDPTPTDTQNEYCEMCFCIDLTSAETTVELLDT